MNALDRPGWPDLAAVISLNGPHDSLRREVGRDPRAVSESREGIGVKLDCATLAPPQLHGTNCGTELAAGRSSARIAAWPPANESQRRGEVIMADAFPPSLWSNAEQLTHRKVAR